MITTHQTNQKPDKKNDHTTHTSKLHHEYLLTAIFYTVRFDMCTLNNYIEAIMAKF
jgi:hypothetical protein